MQSLLPYKQAIEKLLNQIGPAESRYTRLSESLGYILAEPIEADVDLPPFDRAVMDGFAFRAEDVTNPPARLQIVGEANAGGPSPGVVNSSEAVKIMTGAPVPSGADTVEMVEKIETEGDTLIVKTPVPSGQHIAKQGSEVKKNQLALDPNTSIGPLQIGVLASFGYQTVKVFRKPSIGIFSTGDELVDIMAQPKAGQLRDSNSYMLEAQCRRLGLETRRLGSLPDDLEKTGDSLSQANEHDILVLSGGVSMGERDYVQHAVRECGFDVIFHKAAVKPGKPILFGRKNNQLLFGLPGNPVSAFVTFLLFVKPAIRKQMGYSKAVPRILNARLEGQASNHSSRQFYAPARVRWNGKGFTVAAVQTFGSADLTAFSRANALLIIPGEIEKLENSTMVETILFDKQELE